MIISIKAFCVCTATIALGYQRAYAQPEARDGHTSVTGIAVGSTLFKTGENIPVKIREGNTDHSSREDEVILNDGTRIVGEIKSLETGKILIATDNMGDILVDWEAMVYLSGTGPYSVYLKSGERLVGSIVADSVSLTVKNRETRSVAIDRVAYFEDFEVAFWDRAYANIDLGLDIARGNNRISQFILAGNLGYRADVYEVNFRSTTFLNEQTDGRDTRRVTAQFSYNRAIGGRWRASAATSFEYDENQGLNYRIIVPAAVGYRLLSDVRKRFGILVGAGPTFEGYTETANESIVEGLAGGKFLVRPNDDTEIDITFLVFPKLFEFDRVRVQSDVTIRFEIIQDIKLSIIGYYWFNSKPPEEVAKNDFGFTLGFGWSY